MTEVAGTQQDGTPLPAAYRQPVPEVDWRRDPGFSWPERVPWSELGPTFIQAWGRADPANPDPEHMEIVGQNGSGKTYLMCSAMQERMIKRQTAGVIICTKKADKVFAKLGWPIIDNPRDLADNPNAIYWPRTSRTGIARRAFYDVKVNQLLDAMWVDESNRIVAFDEIGYVESLSAEAKANVQMYWREGRSLGITVIGMKQRPQGALRDMHSETYWTAAFRPKDRADLERWAELFGARRDWMPVFDSLDRSKREFIIANPLHDDAYISWVDTPLRPVKPPQQGPRWLRRGRPAA
jgi:nucleoside-triphosphatase THEP1